MNGTELKSLKEWIQSVDLKLNNYLIGTGKAITGIRTDMTEMKTEMTETRTDVSWIKKFFWIAMTVSIGAILTAAFGFILR